MDTIIEIKSVEDATYLAKNLRSCCSAKAGVKLGVGHSLEVVSSLLGASNWDTLRGALLKGTVPDARVAERKKASVPEDENLKVTLFWEVPAALAVANPKTSSSPLQWIELEVTPAWLTYAKTLWEAVSGLPANEIQGACSGVRNRSASLKTNGEASKVAPELHVLPTGVIWVSLPELGSRLAATTLGLDLTKLELLFKNAVKSGTVNLFVAENEFELKEAICEELNLQLCRECEMAYPEAGDGWDGMCPDCADAAESRTT